MSDPRTRRRTLAVVLVGCFVCQMGLGCGYIFGATLKHIVAEFDWSRAAFAAATAPLLLAMGLSAPLVGNLTERVGARNVISTAVVLLGLSLWLFSRMQSLTEFYLTSVLFGVGLTGVGDIAVGAVASRWVESRRGLALALVFIGSNVGGAIVPIAAESIAAQHSWRTALVTIGAATVALILPFSLFAIRDAPAGRGGAGARRDAAGRPVSGHSADLTLAEALRTPSFWILAALLFCFYAYYLAINQHLVAFLSDIGFSNAEAAASLSFAVGLGVLSKVAVGLLADRFAPKRVLMANFSVLTAGSFLLIWTASPGVLPVFLVVHGFATAAENVLLPLMVVHCFGVTHMARIFGALTVALFPGGVLGPVFAGVVFDRVGDYRLAFLGFALLNVASLVALTRLRRETEAGARVARA